MSSAAGAGPLAEVGSVKRAWGLSQSSGRLQLHEAYRLGSQRHPLNHRVAQHRRERLTGAQLVLAVRTSWISETRNCGAGGLSLDALRSGLSVIVCSVMS